MIEIGPSRRVAEQAVRRLRHVPVRRSRSYPDFGCGDGAASLVVRDAFRVRATGAGPEVRR